MISVIGTFSILRAVSRLFILPFIPLTLMVALGISFFLPYPGSPFSLFSRIIPAYCAVVGIGIPIIHLVWFECYSCLSLSLVSVPSGS